MGLSVRALERVRAAVCRRSSLCRRRRPPVGIKQGTESPRCLGWDARHTRRCDRKRRASKPCTADWNAGFDLLPFFATIDLVKRKHQRTLELIFARPVSANVRWSDVEALLRVLGAEFDEREGSRMEVFLFGAVRVFHRPHPSPDTDKGAVVAIRKWLEENGVTP